VNVVLRRMLVILLCLLAYSDMGFGQQGADSSFAALVATAQQAQAAHNYTAAADAYRQALRLRPNMAELWANLGLMQQEAGDMPQSISSFEHASRLNPSLYVPNLFLGVDYAHAGRTKEAIVYLLKAVKENNTDPEPRMALGRAYTTLGDYSRAADAYTEAVHINPRQSSAWFALGIARLNQVETDSRRLVEQDQDSPYAKALFAESLDKQSRYAEAVRAYKSAMDSQPQPPCMHAELGWSLVKEQNPAEASAAFEADSTDQCALSALGQARLTIERGENDEALRILSKLWESDQGFLKANILTMAEGISSDHLEGFDKALEHYRPSFSAELYNLLRDAMTGSATAAEINTTDRTKASTASVASPTLRGTAESYYRLGQYQRCSDRINSSTAPAQPSTLVLQATCSYLTGDYERASQAGAVIARGSTHSAAGLYWSIRSNEKLAFRALARYEELEPNAARSHILLGDILRQRLEYTEALSEYKKAHEIDPADQAAMLGMASAYLDNNNLDKAIETARAALLLSPDDPEINVVMAEGLIARHDYPEAERYLNKGLNAKPQMLPHVHALLGTVYAETGRTQDAIAQLKMAVASDEDGSVHYRLLQIYRQIGDSRSASAVLEELKLIKKREHQRQLFNPEDSESLPADNKPH
jgi:tetratricopeptide (TPR) repeat protein